MQEHLKYYTLARRDFKRGQFPKAGMGFTPGQRAILGQECYKKNWVLRDEIRQVCNEKTEKLRDMIRLQKPHDAVAEVSSAKLDSLKSEFKEVDALVGMKKEELEEFAEDMEVRGVALDIEGVSDKNTTDNTKGNDKPSRKKKWLQALFIAIIYVAIEGFTYLTQLDSLSEIKDVKAIGVRFLGMLVMFGAFHLVGKMNRMIKKTVYIVFLAVDLLMILCTMVLPVTLNLLYPETPVEAVSEWSLSANQAASVASTVENSTVPMWVTLYNKLDWIPAVVIVLFFLVIFFALPNPMTDQEKATNKKKPDEGFDVKLSGAKTLVSKVSSPQSEYDARRKELQKLENNRMELQRKLEEEENNVAKLIPFRDRLLELKQAVSSLDSRRHNLWSEVEVLLTDLDNELKEFQAEYEALLQKDEAKAQLTNLEWPTKKDILNYYKISEL